MPPAIAYSYNAWQKSGIQQYQGQLQTGNRKVTESENQYSEAAPKN